MQFETFFEQRGEFVNLDLTLDRILNALNSLNFCESQLGQIVHIAGTNGKGSTATILSQILQQESLNVGLFTSPHIHSITERIQLNRTPIQRSHFDTLFNTALPSIKSFELSYFETVTLLGLLYFAQTQPDITIIETGMGGLFDASNVLEHKIPVITKIAQDHTNYLGTDIRGIIKEKAGIIKSNQQVFIGNNHPFIINEITRIFSSSQTAHTINKEDITPFSSLYPSPFDENAALATAIATHVLKKPIAPQTYDLPSCRMERHGHIILDGAHNADGLMNTLKNLTKPFTAICSFTEERNVNKLISILRSKTDQIICTEIPKNQRSLKLNTLNLPATVICEPSPELALRKAVDMNSDNDILIIGSLYLCAYVKETLIGK